MRTFCFLVACFAFVLPNILFAQESAGVGISPSLIETGAERGAVLSEEISVRNLSENEETYYIFVRDISGATDSGRPLYAEDGLEPTGFELSAWLTLNVEQITIPAGEERKVSFVINVPNDATPGSHFGAIFASVNAPQEVRQGAGVGFQIANIVTIRVAGDVTENAVLRSFETDKYFFGSKYVTFKSRVENKGNTLLRPIGPIEVTNMLGQKVGTLLMNEKKSGLFPMTTREYEVLWEDSSLGFGRYEAALGMVYGEAGKSQASISSVTSFWILPWVIIQPLLITLLVLFAISYFVVRRLVRAQVARLSGGRRLIRQTSNDGPSLFVLVTVVMLIVTAFALFVLLLLFA